MASLSGNSSRSTQIHNTGSDDQMDKRKRKRMESNRESARRSRMRKQKHIDDMTTQSNQIKNDNDQMMTTINLTTQRFIQIEAENSVLRAQVSELSERLDSLNQMINYINTNANYSTTQFISGTNGLFEFDSMENSWNMMYVNQQPIIASAGDMFGY